jgi:Holliday junction resolvasome RuvABC endonuclease subunit
MRILGIDPGLQRTGFGSGTAPRAFTSATADVSLHRSPSTVEPLHGRAT